MLLSPWHHPEAGGQGLGSVVSVGKKTSTSRTEMGIKEGRDGEIHTKEKVICCELFFGKIEEKKH